MLKPDEPPTPPRIHLVAIGNELLNAEIRDTNLAWLIRKLTRKGGRIVRAAIIPDDFQAVKWEIDHAREQGIDLMITTGGLGPTDDDSTLASVASSIGSPLRMNEDALELVKERMAELARHRSGIPADLTEERKTMAMFPEGGKPLRNPVGVAPGMLYLVDRTHLVALPGVPREMKGIFDETLRDFWKDFFRGFCYVRRNIVIKGIPEADLWPFCRRALKLDPGVYIKTRLKVVGRIGQPYAQLPVSDLPWMIILHFSIIECSKSEGAGRIDRLMDSLVEDLRNNYRYPIHIDLEPGRV